MPNSRASTRARGVSDIGGCHVGHTRPDNRSAVLDRTQDYRAREPRVVSRTSVMSRRYRDTQATSRPRESFARLSPVIAERADPDRRRAVTALISSEQTR